VTLTVPAHSHRLLNAAINLPKLHTLTTAILPHDYIHLLCLSHN